MIALEFAKISTVTAFKLAKALVTNHKKEPLLAAVLDHAKRNPKSTFGVVFELFYICPWHFPALMFPVRTIEKIKQINPTLDVSETIRLGRFVKTDNLFAIGCD